MVKKSNYDPEFSEFTEIWLKQNVTPWVEANGGWEGLNTFLQGRKSIGEYLRDSLTFLWNWNKYYLFKITTAFLLGMIKPNDIVYQDFEIKHIKGEYFA
ncbi:hypothetical protein DPMN_089444 [Dreissena polymorpha]|uniref:Uncharacterized protein n=1 Tax=Dreissena polymorpha TaxID=45954 RepID=A0A9D4KWY9_DREPO|nr:hypothetical protein DPMN_089444 [Dreissena polymorpha]